MLFEAGVLLSAIYLLVRMSWVKKIISGSVMLCLSLPLLLAPPVSLNSSFFSPYRSIFS